jgi:hypothetical protein
MSMINDEITVFFRPRTLTENLASKNPIKIRASSIIALLKTTGNLLTCGAFVTGIVASYLIEAVLWIRI